MEDEVVATLGVLLPKVGAMSNDTVPAETGSALISIRFGATTVPAPLVTSLGAGPGWTAAAPVSPKALPLLTVR